MTNRGIACHADGDRVAAPGMALTQVPRVRRLEHGDGLACHGKQARERTHGQDDGILRPRGSRAIRAFLLQQPGCEADSAQCALDQVGRWTTVARRLVRSIIKTRSKGSLTNIDNLLLRSGQFLQLEHIVRTVIDAVTAARANRRLLMGGVPDRRAKGTGADAVSAPDAELRVKTDAAVGAYFKRIGGTHPCAGRVGARPARDDDEAFTNAPCGADPDSGSGETRGAGPAGTGKDTELTADTVVGIENG